MVSGDDPTWMAICSSSQPKGMIILMSNSGDDTIQGFGGADILKGSSGNDRIFHFISDLTTFRDSSKDTIDCGLWK